MLFSLAFSDKKIGRIITYVCLRNYGAILLGQQYISVEQITTYCSMISYIVTSLTTLGYSDFIFAKEYQRGRLLEIFVVTVLGKN